MNGEPSVFCSHSYLITALTNHRFLPDSHNIQTTLVSCYLRRIAAVTGLEASSILSLSTPTASALLLQRRQCSLLRMHAPVRAGSEARSVLRWW